MKDNAQQQKILLQEHLSKVSSKILSSSFRFNLTPDASKDPQKPLYSIGATAEEFFAMQVLCRNVKKLFKISMSSRHEILSQLKILLREDKAASILSEQMFAIVSSLYRMISCLSIWRETIYLM